MEPTQNSSTEQSKYSKARHRLAVVWTWVGAILLCGVAVYLSGPLSNAIGVIVWTVVFVFILRGPVNWLDKRGVNRALGTAISYVLFVAVLGLILFIMFSPAFGLSEQFEDLAVSIPSYIEAFRVWVSDLYEQYADMLQNESVRTWIEDVSSSVGGFVQTFASTTATGLVAVGASLANIIMCIGFALVIAFWMLVDLPKLGREANRVIGEKYRDDAQMIHLTVTRVMGGYLRATIIQCAAIGLACGVMFWILNIPSPAAFAVITGLLNIIPIVGPWLGGVLAFVASVTVNPIVGIIALVGTVVIQQVIYTFVSPKLMGESVDIHPAFTFIALMAGSGIGSALSGLVGSLVGALLSIPLVAMAKSLFVYYFEKWTGRRIVSEDGVFFRGVSDTGEEVDPIVDATAPVPAPSPSNTGKIMGLTGKIPRIDLDGSVGKAADKADADKKGDKPAHRK